jgi:hypothetical protein
LIQNKLLASQMTIHSLAPNYGLIEAISAEAREEKAEGGDHPHHAKISRRQQARQDDRANHLGGQHQRLGGYP